MSAMVEPFTLAVPDADLENLRARLRATRWPEPATHPRQGVALERLQERCARWAHGYDWRDRAEPQRRAAVHHHDRWSADPFPARPLLASDAFPPVLTHGWPGSVVEYLDVLPLLIDAGFHCVVPSLPGYGWSGEPTEPGWGRIARAWATLMARLGYARYGAQGSDWGTSVSASLSDQDRAHVAGIHLMPPLAPTSPVGPPGDDDAGYSTQHRTRPQTVGYALTDSPAGLAAWIGEKLDSSTDPGTPIPEHRILDTLTLYWLPRTAASSTRLYWESLGDVTRWLAGPLERGDLFGAPTGCTIFPHELQRPTRDEAAARFRDIRYWSEPERGGHFPAPSDRTPSRPSSPPCSRSSADSANRCSASSAANRQRPPSAHSSRPTSPNNKPDEVYVLTARGRELLATSTELKLSRPNPHTRRSSKSSSANRTEERCLGLAPELRRRDR
jgi:epoxide hydrolase